MNYHDIFSVITQYVGDPETARSIYATSTDLRRAIYREYQYHPRENWFIAWAVIIHGDMNRVRYLDPEIIYRLYMPRAILPTDGPREIRSLPRDITIDDLPRGRKANNYARHYANIYEVIASENVPLNILRMRMDSQNVMWQYISQLQMSRKFLTEYAHKIYMYAYCDAGILDNIDILIPRVNVMWHIICTRGDLSLEFLRKYIEHLNWTTLSSNTEVPDDFILEYHDRLDMTIMTHNLFSKVHTSEREEVIPRIIKLANVLSWMTISDYSYMNASTRLLHEIRVPQFWNNCAMHQKFTQPVIRYGASCGLLSFRTAVQYQHLTEKSILHFGKQIDFHLLLMTYELSAEFLSSNIVKLNTFALCRYQKLSAEFITKHEDFIHWRALAAYQDLAVSIQYKYEERIFKNLINATKYVPPTLLMLYHEVINIDRLDISLYNVDTVTSIASIFGWTKIAEHPEIPADVLRQHAGDIAWSVVSSQHKLSHAVLDEFAHDKIIWILYMNHHRVTPAFVRRYQKYINMSKLFKWCPYLDRGELRDLFS